MDTTYIDFALTAARHSKDLSSSDFAKLCVAGVSSGIHGVNERVITSALACRLIPTYRAFTGDLLISNHMVPMQNASEVFEYIKSLGATREEMALMREDDGTINFVLSYDGLKRCADHCEAVKNMLEHVDWVITAYELYTANK